MPVFSASIWIWFACNAYFKLTIIISTISVDLHHSHWKPLWACACCACLLSERVLWRAACHAAGATALSKSKSKSKMIISNAGISKPAFSTPTPNWRLATVCSRWTPRCRWLRGAVMHGWSSLIRFLQAKNDLPVLSQWLQGQHSIRTWRRHPVHGGPASLPSAPSSATTHTGTNHSATKPLPSAQSQTRNTTLAAVVIISCYKWVNITYNVIRTFSSVRSISTVLVSSQAWYYIFSRFIIYVRYAL